MKKQISLISSLMFFLSTSLLIGCNTIKLPTTQYEKVKFAFNGVERSMKKKEVNKLSHIVLDNKKSKIGGTNLSQGLSAIYNLYQDGDLRGDNLDDLEYNQPPMIQFQYLKKVFEKIGSNFSFDSKYYDVIEGDVYIDINTGEKSDKQEDKCSYQFTLGIDINIDSNDLINADVSFDIELTKGSNKYNTNWYVTMLLDYDMENASPNYTLTMVTENDEKQLPYYNAYTYEYDYVEVKENKINEWRKFDYSTSEKLVKDNDHQTFQSYLSNESFTYKVDYCPWYKNNKYYKFTRMSEDNKQVIAKAFFEDLGLNSTEINASVFTNKEGIKNTAIKDIYKEFTKIAKEDIIYSLLVKESASDHHGGGDNGGSNNQDANIAGIIAKDHNNEEVGLIELPDVSFREMFNGFVNTFNGQKEVIHLDYVDINKNVIREVDDYDRLTYVVGYEDYQDMVELDDKLSDIIDTISTRRSVDKITLKNSDLTLLIANVELQIGGALKFRYTGEIHK